MLKHVPLPDFVKPNAAYAVFNVTHSQQPGVTL